jgi:hypothetical protein
MTTANYGSFNLASFLFRDIQHSASAIQLAPDPSDKTTCVSSKYELFWKRSGRYALLRFGSKRDSYQGVHWEVLEQEVTRPPAEQASGPERNLDCGTNCCFNPMQ